MIIFVDTLAGVKFPEIIAQLDPKYGTGYFWEEFGNAKKQVNKDAKSGRTFIRIQGLWAGKSHNYTSEHRSKALKFARHIEQLAKENKKLDLYYSPFCEHKKDAKFMRQLFKELEKICPSVTLVNSPISGGQWLDGYVNEIHHNDKPPGMPKGKHIYSMDGLHQPDCDITKYLKYLNDPNCIAFGVWGLQDNCKRNAKDQTPALERKCKPTHDFHLSLIFQVEKRKLNVELQDGWIAKTHSEQHKDVDPRANKIVLVGPKGKKQKKVSIGGIELQDGGLTEDKRNTWRSNLWGFKQPRSPMKVVADGKTVGNFDPAFRQNEWREKT